MAEKLSDDQLRKELIAFGEKSLGPIVASTRPIYTKKLNHYRAREKPSTSASKRRVPSKKLLGFSSDESEDDTDSRGTSRERGGASLDVSKSTTQNRRKAQSGPRSGRTPKTVNSDFARPALRSYKVDWSNYQNDLADDVDMSHVSMASAGAQTSFLSFNDTMDSENSFDFDSHEESLPGWKTGESSDSDVPELPTKANSYRHDLNESSTAGCSSWGSNSNNSHSYNSHPTLCSVKHRNSPKYSSLSQNNQKANAHSGLYQNHSSSHFSSRAAKPKPQFRDVDESYSNRSHYISMLLLLLAGLFFSVLAFVYMNMSGTVSTDTTANLNICPGNTRPSQKDSDPCFPKDQVVRVMPLIVKLSNHLSYQAGQYLCGNSDNGVSMNIVDFLEYAREQLGSDDKGDVNVALTLIHKNPQWDICLQGADHTRLSEKAYSPASVVFLEALTPDMTLWCRLCRATSKVFYILVLTASGVIVFSIGLALLRYRWRRQKAEVEALYSLVEQIVNAVRCHHDNYMKAKEEGQMELLPYLAIPHVRDMLIPANERCKKKKLWEKAVKFISATESRVREEIQMVANEEYSVWRWLQPTCTNGRKVWQGQAFGENAKSSVNMPPYSPTPCLKIRNMFDAEVEYGEDWHVGVQDAILEKCGSKHSIIHIAVEKSSKEGCVYVMCSNPEDAGKVYKALHGSYFDGVLVTVKYIRMERYYERFPEAQEADEPLRPSNNEKRSLSQPLHSSIIESS